MTPLRTPRERAPADLHERAAENMAFVRDVMERSTTFTAVPGWGGVAMGATGIVAAVVAASQSTPQRWLGVWLGEAALGGMVGLVAVVEKARRAGVPLAAGPARRFGLCLAPALVAGGVLTLACVQVNAWSLLPPLWLLLYGAGVVAAGAVSAAPIVPLLGAAFIAAGTAAAFSPPSWGNWFLGALFGVAHAVAGLVIVRRHGG